MFRGGLDGIFGIAKRHFESVGPMPADMAGFWDAFLPVQGTYLTLCTVLERYTAFVFGPSLDPGQRLRGLRDDPAAMDAMDAMDAVEAAKPPQIPAAPR